MDWRKKLKQTPIYCLLYLLLLTSIVISTVAQEQNKKPASSGWSNEQWEESRKGLNYEEEKKKEQKRNEEIPSEDNSVSDTTDNKRSISEVFSDFFNSGIGKVLSIVLVIALLVFTIIRIITVRGVSQNLKIKKNVSLEEINEVEDNLPESDLEQYLKLALEKGDHKLAVRILFLTTIQKLNEAGFILWKKDKTNQDYLYEMRKKNNYQDFQKLTLTYELVWYGDTDITAGVFEKITPLFNSYNSKLYSDGN